MSSLLMVTRLCDFFFYRVHGPEDSQDAVFEEVKPLVTSLLDG